ncbi:MAG: hypothetical protein AUG74_15690 [Bacteroidetes bacterium 13_1_20CM_4_60_6]|nr:MAG: hypothetical protein AUG74_15690 [Bacteroidetes bacterium 13_1_20CM_4_60_6]
MTLDYPIVPAIHSILDMCDEVVVNVGRSDDGTRDLIASLGDARIRILDTVWDFSRGGHTLSHETNRAMAACRGSWGVYIQADEVLHEAGAAILRDQVRAVDGDPRVEGLLVEYRHFYGDFGTLATNRHWYRREVRVVRLGRDIRSYQDAQGFRVGDELRRVRARVTGALMFHYGWARAQQSVGTKLAASKQIFLHARERLEQGERVGQLEWTPLLRRFTGTHPQAAALWVERRAAEGGAPPFKSRPFALSDLRFYLSDWIERLTGTRLFEYRNYVVV